MREIQISKQDLRVTRIVDATPAPLGDGAARLKLDLFALTANNITYAAMGTGVLGYWDFFPAPDGWGKAPVWGFATVAESNAPGVEAGARYYGYYALAETLDVIPTKAGSRGFADAAPHRAQKAAVYNQYVNVAADSAYDAAFEPEQTLFRPLYATGWWAAECIRRDNPRTVVLSSASSKTALATAHQLRQLGGSELVALTSANNEAYVRETGLYDRTVTYENVDAVGSGALATYVDFLGRAEVIGAAHRALGSKLTRSILIGATDWTDRPGGVEPPQDAIIGPTPEFFFVPTYAAGRLSAEPELAATMQRDMRAFYETSRAFVTARRLSGTQAIAQSWSRLTDGRVPPREGLVLSF